MAKYLPQTLPPPPDEVDWLSKIPPSSWGAMGNLQAGCCALSAVGHIRQQQTFFASGTAQIVPDELVIGWYADLTGYNPSDPNTDRGTVMADALERWLHPGFAVGPDTFERISAYCTVSPTSRLEVQRAINWFGSVYVGISLPNAWQKKGPWDVGPNGPTGDWTPGSWGGHAIPIFAFNVNYLYCITWGEVQAISWQAFHQYADEAYVTLSEDWKRPPGYTPSGIPWTELVADMDVIRNGG